MCVLDTAAIAIAQQRRCVMAVEMRQKPLDSPRETRRRRHVSKRSAEPEKTLEILLAFPSAKKKYIK